MKDTSMYQVKIKLSRNEASDSLNRRRSYYSICMNSNVTGTVVTSCYLLDFSGRQERFSVQTGRAHRKGVCFTLLVLGK